MVSKKGIVIQIKNILVETIRSLFYGTSGLLSFFFISTNLAFWIVPVTLLALFKLAVPVSKLKDLSYRTMVWIYGTAVRTNDFLLFKLMGNTLDFRGTDILEKDKNSLILSNHRSWADILILQSILNRRTPPIRFIVKRELIFMPIVGLICWAYEYPFVRRRSLKFGKGKDSKTKSDLNTIRSKIDKMSATNLSLINFVEGTRFNILKSERHASPFKHLLNPHVGGLFNILKNYWDRLDQVLNFTIVYQCQSPIFWNLLGGRCRRVILDLQKIEMKDILLRLRADEGDLNFMELSEWLRGLWLEKDLKIDKIIGEPEFEKTG